MGNKAKHALIRTLSSLSAKNPANTVSPKNQPLAIVLPIEDQQKFQAEREAQLKQIKKELNGILALIRKHTGHQTLEEVEARLAALRQEIEQEQKQGEV